MPGVDHLSNKGSANVVLDRSFGGRLAGVPHQRSLMGLFTNFVRLTDKALREYDAARAELQLFVAPQEGLNPMPYVRAIDHMENCLGAAHRAVLLARALRSNRVGRGAARLTELQERRLKNVRDAIEHSDEKLLGKQKFKTSPPFAPREPYSLRLANTSLVIGQHHLTYKDLVSAMTKMHATIELVRGVPTGTPGPDFPNAILRTDADVRTSVRSTGRATFQPSPWLREVSRLSVTH